MGVWVNATATRVSDGLPAVSGVDYNGPVNWYYAWNANPPLSPSASEYPAGWNNLNPQMFYRPGTQVDPAFTFNITDYSKFCETTCVGTIDPGTGGHRLTLSDIVVAAPPVPPAGSSDVGKLIVPLRQPTPFPYPAGLPMLVTVQVQNATTHKSDPNALRPPHAMSLAVLDAQGNRQPVEFPTGFPTTFTYNPLLKVYYILLSPRPYTLGTVYQLQVNSDLFPQPLNANIVVKKLKH
jgi:hypothetical protein